MTRRSPTLSRIIATAALGLIAAVCATCTRAQDELSGECPESPKTCDDRCVAVDDPRYGCRAEGCTPCDLPGAIATCESNRCAVGECEEMQGDCDGIAENGCEIDLRTDVSNCGECGVTCSGHAAVACVAGVCEVQTCDAGFSDCDDDGQNGCETDIDSSDEHCGACGRDCNGGICEAGRCSAVVLFDGDAEHQPMGVAVDDEYVYWANFVGSPGRIYRLPKSVVGASPSHPDLTIIVDGQVTPFGVAVNDTEIYWTAWGGGSGTNQGLFRGPKSGVATPEALPGAFTAPSGVRLQGDFVYWTNLGNFGDLPTAHGIWRLDLGASPLQPEIFHVGCGNACNVITDVAPTADLVYWPLFLGSDGGGAIQAKQYPIEGPTLTRDFEDLPRFVTTDESSVYWTTNSEAGGVRRSDRSLSDAEEVLSGLNFPTGIAVDEDSIFVGELNTQRLLRVAKPR